MLDANLGRPAPQIAGVGEGRNGERCKGCGRKRRDEEGILAGDHGSVLPVEARLAVCRRAMPKLTPLLVAGKPPAKSNCTLAEVFAPARVGPKISRPISVCRRVAPKLALECCLGRRVRRSWASRGCRRRRRCGRHSSAQFRRVGRGIWRRFPPWSGIARRSSSPAVEWTLPVSERGSQVGRRGVAEAV